MIVKLRLLGADDEIERVLAVLRAAAGAVVAETGHRYRNRRDPGVRAYVTVDVAEEEPTA